MKRYTAEEIVDTLHEGRPVSQGQTVAQVAKQIGVTDQTYYRWRKEYGGLKADQAKKLKAVERENSPRSTACPNCRTPDSSADGQKGRRSVGCLGALLGAKRAPSREPGRL